MMTAPQRRTAVAAPPWEPRQSAARQVLAALALDHKGLIADCSTGAEQLFTASRDELVGRHISTLIPRLAGKDIIRDGQVDPNVSYLCHCGVPFRARRPSGDSFVGELSFNRFDNGQNVTIRVIVRELQPSAAAGVETAPWCLE